MRGDPTDMRKRLRMALPVRWFSDVAPVLDGLLCGFALAWSTFYDLIQNVTVQSRIATATGEFLDLAAQDYLSDSFLRRSNETDTDYRNRLLAAMHRSRATRPAIVAAAAAAGYSLSIFEPAQPASTGAYNVPLGLAWNHVGGWGSMQMPLESLIVAKPEDISFEGELWQAVGHATPAGGALWLSITHPN